MCGGRAARHRWPMACTLALVILGIFALCAVEGISCPSGMASKKEKKGAKWEVAHSLCMYRRRDTHTQKMTTRGRRVSAVTCSLLLHRLLKCSSEKHHRLVRERTGFQVLSGININKRPAECLSQRHLLLRCFDLHRSVLGRSCYSDAAF
jgi:hypothetical protein